MYLETINVIFVSLSLFRQLARSIWHRWEYLCPTSCVCLFRLLCMVNILIVISVSKTISNYIRNKRATYPSSATRETCSYSRHLHTSEHLCDTCFRSHLLRHPQLPLTIVMKPTLIQFVITMLISFDSTLTLNVLVLWPPQSSQPVAGAYKSFRVIA